MRRFKNIMFVNEPGSRARSTPQRAVKLAKLNNAELTLCDARPELPRTLLNLKSAYKQIHEKEVLAQFAQVDMKGLKVKTRMLTGTPFIEVIKEVQRGKHDLVIKPAEGRGVMFGGLFGEMDLRLIRKCPCPVWIVKSTKNKKHARIMAAVDPNPDRPANAELNKLILELAISLAREEDSELHIVHAWHFQGEDLFRGVRSNLSKQQVDKIAKETLATHQGWLDTLLKQHDMTGIVTKVHLVKGDPSKTIPQLASKKKADLIVMGTIGRTGVEGFIIGNTAEKILRAVDCSVLTVKPKAFKTPVK